MSSLAGCRAVVAGAGAFGLAAAVRLQLEGAEVRLVDPMAVGDSASGVAAGMLSPGLESLLDTASAGHFGLLSRARDLWPGFLDLVGIDAALIDRSGALFLPDTAGAAAAMQTRFLAAGGAAELLDEGQARRLAPGLAIDRPALFFPGEWRISPAAALKAMAAVFLRRGGLIERGRLTVVDGVPALSGGARLEADVAVIASGAEAAALRGAAPVLAHLQPIKGQILHFAGGPTSGPVVRTPRGYVAPQPGGAVAGATMEAGLSDRQTDPTALERLRHEAESLFPVLASVSAAGMAGVRASTPDGLPLVGRVSERMVVAVGARRNGWLLAPLVADLVVGIVAGGAPTQDGLRLSPERLRGG